MSPGNRKAVVCFLMAALDETLKKGGMYNEDVWNILSFSKGRVSCSAFISSLWILKGIVYSKLKFHLLTTHPDVDLGSDSVF